MDLKKISKQNEKLDLLYQEIGSWKPIISEESKGTMWGSHINERGECVVSYANTQNSAAALAHELLHFKVQKEGYVRTLSMAAPKKSLEIVSILSGVLDNELQHHKMFPFFQKLGFESEAFYCDDDANTEAKISENLKTPSQHLLFLFQDYLTISAPGGGISGKAKSRLMKKFRTCYGDSQPFDKIDIVLAEWTQSSNYHPKDTIRSFFEILGLPRKVWFGETVQPSYPDQGYFLFEDFDLSTIND